MGKGMMNHRNFFYSDEYLLHRRKREYISGKIKIKDGVAFWVSNEEIPVYEGVAIALDRLGFPVNLEKTDKVRKEYLKNRK